MGPCSDTIAALEMWKMEIQSIDTFFFFFVIFFFEMVRRAGLPKGQDEK